MKFRLCAGERRATHAGAAHGEVASALQAVRASITRSVVKLTFEFLVLTATRSGEVRGAVWKEIDRDEGVWTIPARRTKGNRVHRVPLSRRSLEILEEARAIGGGAGGLVSIVRQLIRQHGSCGGLQRAMLGSSPLTRRCAIAVRPLSRTGRARHSPAVCQRVGRGGDTGSASPCA